LNGITKFPFTTIVNSDFQANLQTLCPATVGENGTKMVSVFGGMILRKIVSFLTSINVQENSI
jgi:hypothetical protein